MPLLNYTTTIDAAKSIAEIQAMLINAGAAQIMTEAVDRKIAAINFRIDSEHGVMTFRLPANVNAVHIKMQRTQKVAYRFKTRDQAERVAWRILKDWLEAQLALISLGMVEFPQVFLPYMQDDTGRTLYEALKEKKFAELALPAHAST